MASVVAACEDNRAAKPEGVCRPPHHCSPGGWVLVCRGRGLAAEGLEQSRGFSLQDNKSSPPLSALRKVLVLLPLSSG